MKNWFKKAVMSEGEQALKSWGVKYKRRRDGSLYVPGNLDIAGKGLAALPDLSAVTVGGDFACQGNRLTSLKNAPQSVAGNVWCNNNQLTSLEHAPRFVGGSFGCGNNLLTSLKYAPQAIGCTFYCQGNQLTSLEHAPQIFMKLKSDFGEFRNWNDVPQELRRPPEKKQGPQPCAVETIVLQRPIKIRPSLKLKVR
jgi:hypothetical protein